MQFGTLNNTEEGAMQKNKRLLQKCCIAAAAIISHVAEMLFNCSYNAAAAILLQII